MKMTLVGRLLLLLLIISPQEYWAYESLEDYNNDSMDNEVQQLDARNLRTRKKIGRTFRRAIRPSGDPETVMDSEGRVRFRRSRLNLRELILGDEEDDVNIQLMSDQEAQSLTVRRDDTKADPFESWYGLDEQSGNSLTVIKTMTRHGREVTTGTLYGKNGTIYQIRTLADGDVVAEEMKQEMFPKDIDGPETNTEGDDDIDPDTIDQIDGLPSNRRQLRNLDSSSEIDIMVLYTRGAMCAAAGYGSGGACTATSNNMATIQGLINLAISETNQAYRNSNIPTRLRLVKVHYDDSYNDYRNDWEVTLSNLRNNNDGQLDYVHAMRDQFGADFVSMIVDTGSYCGIGFRPTSPTAGDAFSLVQWSCATGYYSFGHELAHNMGCNHDRANSEPPYTGDNYGYQDPSNAFRSIMSYDCPTPCPRIQYFSNPYIRYNGRPLGNAGADNASVIRDTLAAHANYRQSVAKVGSNSDPRISTSVPRLTRAPTPSPPSGPPTNTRSSATVFSGGLIGAAGNMFDIRAKANIRITNFAVHATSATAVTVEIWKKKTVGSFVGSESNSNLWEFLGETSFISQATGNPSILPVNSFPSVAVKEGDIQAFYITFSGDTNYNRYSPGSAVGKVQVSNRDFDLLEGYAKAYIFGDNYFPRAFNGVIFYELGSSSSQPPPTPRPTPPPTPTKVPTKGSSTRISKRISTPFAGGNGQAGNMIQVQSSQDIVLRTFDIHTYSTSRVHVFVYYKKGSYIGFETDPDAWTLMADAWIDGRGSPNPTRIPEREMTPLSIRASETYSFYITLTDSSIRYTNGRIVAGDENVKFIRSAGNKYPFGAYYPDRIWNGNLYYTINSGNSDKKL